MFKYNLDQVVFFISNNKIASAPILACMCVENLHEDWASTDAQKKTWTPFGLQGNYYATVHGVFLESKLFTSKEDLINNS